MSGLMGVAVGGGAALMGIAYLLESLGDYRLKLSYARSREFDAFGSMLEKAKSGLSEEHAYDITKRTLGKIEFSDSGTVDFFGTNDSSSGGSDGDGGSDYSFLGEMKGLWDKTAFGQITNQIWQWGKTSVENGVTY